MPLRDVSLKIPAGQSLALVGHNGAGKTTFIKLLCGLYQPTEGRILLDGKDLSTLPPDAVRKRMGVVFQDFGQYQFPCATMCRLAALRIPTTNHGSSGHLNAAVPMNLYAVFRTESKRCSVVGFTKESSCPADSGSGLRCRGRLFAKEADILVLDEPTAAL